MSYQKLIESGGRVEIWEYEKQPLVRKSYGPRKPTIKRARRWDNILRQKRSFIRLVRSNLTGDERPAFLTLTMYQVLRIGPAYQCFTAFSRRIIRDFGSQIRYIAVPEFQKRGAVHFHVLIWGLPQYVVSKERSTRILQSRWLYGFCDIIPTDGSVKLASYLSKYMSKALSDYRLDNKKGYTTTRNVMRPMCLSGSVQLSYSDIIIDLSTYSQLDYQRSFDTQWLGKCVYKVYSKK